MQYLTSHLASNSSNPSTGNEGPIAACSQFAWLIWFIQCSLKMASFCNGIQSTSPRFPTGLLELTEFLSVTCMFIAPMKGFLGKLSHAHIFSQSRFSDSTQVKGPGSEVLSLTVHIFYHFSQSRFHSPDYATTVQQPEMVRRVRCGLLDMKVAG